MKHNDVIIRFDDLHQLVERNNDGPWHEIMDLARHEGKKIPACHDNLEAREFEPYSGGPYRAA